MSGIFTDGTGYGMVASGFRRCGPSHQFVGCESAGGMYFLHPEDAASQCAGLIEYYGIYMGNGIQIVTAFEQDAPA